MYSTRSLVINFALAINILCLMSRLGRPEVIKLNCIFFPLAVSGEQSDINPLTIQSPAITFTSSSHMACSTIFVLGDSTLEERIETFNISLVSAARRDDPDHIRLVNASAQVLVEDIDGMCRLSTFCELSEIHLTLYTLTCLPSSTHTPSQW